VCVFNSTTRARHADNNPKPKAFLELSGHVRARHPHNLRELAAAEDIKPRNWVYEADGRTIKLIDFGFSVKGVLARWPCPAPKRSQRRCTLICSKPWTREPQFCFFGFKSRFTRRLRTFASPRVAVLRFHNMESPTLILAWRILPRITYAWVIMNGPSDWSQWHGAFWIGAKDIWTQRA